MGGDGGGRGGDGGDSGDSGGAGCAWVCARVRPPARTCVYDHVP